MKSTKSSASASADSSSLNPNRSRSRGQLQRKHSTTRYASGSKGQSLANSGSRSSGGSGSTPLLGGLYWNDFFLLIPVYVLNLIRTCGLAELFDAAFKGFVYLVSGLPVDFYQRWNLSQAEQRSSKETRKLQSKQTSNQQSPSQSTSTITSKSTPKSQLSNSKLSPTSTLDSLSLFASSSQPGSSNWSNDPTSNTDQKEPLQLSPFHHLVILLTKFACTNFPHLLPRVLFAEETIGAFFDWRTGGGAKPLVHTLLGKEIPVEEDTSEQYGMEDESESKKVSGGKLPLKTVPSFRAQWIGNDAMLSTEMRAASRSAQHATTICYLHGGGFSLGSAAFYAEALLRILVKINSLEKELDPNHCDARCVAVEYDLAPTARFPHPLLQCLRCYRHLIEVEKINPANIILSGDSAGGNLVMSMLLILSGQYELEKAMPGIGMGRECDWKQLPLPGKAILLSPWVDLRPSKAHAFAHLRDLDGNSKQPSLPFSSTSTPNPEVKPVKSDASWAAAISAYEWDYVTGETLLHFAQLYAGVLDTPRRVSGPLGWIANICGAVADGFPTSEKAARIGETPGLSSGKRRKSKSKGRKNGKASSSSNLSTSVSSSPGGGEGLSESNGSAAARTLFHAPRALAVLTAPPRRVARRIQEALTEPVFLNSSIKQTKLKNSSQLQDFSTVQLESFDSSEALLAPIFPANERKTDIVSSRHLLYVPFKASDPRGGRFEDGATGASSSDTETESDASKAAKASRILDTHPLISPILGDWSSDKIKLEGGMLVSWGERERMATDIQGWVERAKAGKGSMQVEEVRGRSQERRRDSRPNQDGKSPDSDEEKMSGDVDEEKKDHANWIHPTVQHGAGGVHVWPFVSMYLAGTEAEREQGLDMFARFCASKGPSIDDSSKEPRTRRSQPIPTPTYGPHSPPQTVPDSSSTGFQINTSAYREAQRGSYGVSPADSHGSMPSDVGMEDERNYGFGYPRGSDFGYNSESASGSFSPEETHILGRAEQNSLGLKGFGLDEDQSQSPSPARDAGSEDRRLGLGLDVFPGEQVGTDTMQIEDGEYEGHQDQSSEEEGNEVQIEGLVDEPSQAPISSPDPEKDGNEDGSERLTPKTETHQPVFLTRYESQGQSPSSPGALLSLNDPPSPTRSFGSRSSGSASPGRRSGTLRSPASDSPGSGSRGRSNVTSNPLWWEAQNSDEVQRPNLHEQLELEDIEEVSEGALSGFSSPNRVASPPGFESLGRPSESYSGSFASAGLSMGDSAGQASSSFFMDPSTLSQFQSGFAFHRPEPEGLSDITEEGSVLSASITSGGGAGWDGSMSPPLVRQSLNNPTMHQQSQSRMPNCSEGPSVLRSALQERDREWEARRNAALRNEQSVQAQEGDFEDEYEDNEEDVGENPVVGNLAFSPPAAPQPGPGIPLTSSRSRPGWQSSEDLSNLASTSTMENPSASTANPDQQVEDDDNPFPKPIPRKKPKGDVWW